MLLASGVLVTDSPTILTNPGHRIMSTAPSRRQHAGNRVGNDGINAPTASRRKEKRLLSWNLE